MNSKERIGLIPPRHQEIIDALVSGESPKSLESIPEGNYVRVEEEAYGGNFITCPAILIDRGDGPPGCLHVTFDELIKAIKEKKFQSDIDFNDLLDDLKQAKGVKVLLSQDLSTGESRDSDLEKLRKSVKTIVGTDINLDVKSVPGNQFQLVITGDAVSIWSGTKFSGIV